MLDPKYLRNDIQIEEISKQLANRGYQLDTKRVSS